MLVGSDLIPTLRIACIQYFIFYSSTSGIDFKPQTNGNSNQSVHLGSRTHAPRNRQVLGANLTQNRVLFAVRESRFMEAECPPEAITVGGGGDGVMMVLVW